MSIAWLIVIFIVLLVGGFYIHTVSRVSRLDSAARTLAGDIDTIIWDRNFVWEKIAAFLEGKGITLDEELTKKLPLSLGMPVSLQMSDHTILQTRRKALDGILEEHPELKEDEELKPLVERFDQLRVNLISASSKYNTSARTFNGCVEKGFASFVAARKKKTERPYFSYEIAEVSVK